MTPADPSWETVAAKLRMIEDSLDHLSRQGEVTVDELEANLDRRAIVERLLSRIVDLAVDVNSHVAVHRLQRAPDSYRSSFRFAIDAGLIDRALGDRLAPSAGLRNAIVHDYVELDLGVLASSVPQVIEDYGSYVSQVAGEIRRVRDADTPGDGDARRAGDARR